MKKYVLGIDYGTLSVRTSIISIEDGHEIATIEKKYEHGVISNKLFGTKLNDDTALQNPRDYLDALEYCIPKLIEKSNVKPVDILAIGIDFTSSTVLPVDKNANPIVFRNEFKNNPHAYVKLWKHHSAQKYADIININAEKNNEKWLNNYGGKISSEWLFPKLLEIYYKDKEIYDAMDYFVEAGDWIVWQLTGKYVKSYCMAGFKSIWDSQNGFPSKDFFKKIDPKLENICNEKLSYNIQKNGRVVGRLKENWAKKLGLEESTLITTAIIDAHAFAPAINVVEPNKMFAIIGTSTCHIILSENYKKVPGVCGIVKDGIVPGYYAYEAGQAAVGDILHWFTENYISKDYQNKAKEKKINIHEYLSEKANELEVGENKLLALDWWNGNRSTLVNSELSGMIIGLNLLTKPEEIYRALIESTAFGTKMIMETFIDSGIAIEEFYATGGIPQKNSLMMQIYADVLEMEVNICDTKQGGALGAAIFAAASIGESNGGYDDIFEATKKMSKKVIKKYTPKKENSEKYNKLYKIYKELYNYFGKENKHLMTDLKKTI